MAVRVLAYTARLYQDLLRVRSDPLPPVLPIVLYHGAERWTASEEVAGLAASCGEFLAPIARVVRVRAPRASAGGVEVAPGGPKRNNAANGQGT